MNKKTGVICLGEILIDVISNEPGRPWQEVRSWTPFTGGAPANVAFTLQHLGFPAAFVGCLGNDPIGLKLREELMEAGIDIQGLQTAVDAPTREIYVERDARGERFFAGFGGKSSNDFADTRLAVAALNRMQFETYRCLLLGTLLMPYPSSRAALLESISLAKAHGMIVAMDVNWRPVFWQEPDAAPAVIKNLLRQMDIIKLSENEAGWLFNTEDPGELARIYPQARVILVSRGEQGCNYLVDGFLGHAPAFLVDAVDTTGAGDNFMAGFLFKYLQQTQKYTADAAHDAVQFACAMGALCTTQSGAVSAATSLADVNKFIQAQHSLN